MNEVVEQAEVLISSDNKVEFISFMRSQVKEFAAAAAAAAAADDDDDQASIPLPLPFQSELFKLICHHRAVHCGRALLEEVGDQVNVYEPLEGIGYSPLHLAARSLSYGLCNLFLDHYHGLHIGSKRDVPEQDILPLSLALDALCEQKHVNDWTPAQSIYKLFRIFCYPALREAIDTIELLAWKEDQIERVGFDCVDQWKLVQFSALLYVAWQKFVSPDVKYIGSPIKQYISKTRKKLIDFQLSMMQLWMIEVLMFLDRNLFVIQRYRNSDEVKFAPKHFLPDNFSSKLEFERDMYMYPENFKKIGIDCLPTQLLPAEKAELEKALEMKMDSEPTSIIGPIFFEPLSPYQDDNCFSDDDDYDYRTPEEKVDNALEQDNQDGFKEAMMEIKSLYKPELAKRVAIGFIPYLFRFDCINCANAVIRGEMAQTFDFDWHFHGKKWTPLHHAASIPAPRLTKLFLEKGCATYARCDYDEFNLKEALPLHIALANIRAHPGFWHWPATNSVADLIAELCSTSMRRCLETVRLLAENTLGLKDEFLNYLKEGRTVEPCALLIVAYKQLGSFIHQSHSSNEFQAFHGTRSLDSPKMTPSLSPYDSGGRMGYCTAKLSIALDESENVRYHKGIPLLFNIFSKIGDQLGAYVQLEDKTDWDRSLVEVAWLMEKAGFLVNRNREVAKVHHVASSISPMDDLDMPHPVRGGKLPIPNKKPKQASAYPKFMFIDVHRRGFHTQAPSILNSTYIHCRELYSPSLKPHLDLASVTTSQRLIGARHSLHPFNRCSSVLKVLKRGLRCM